MKKLKKLLIFASLLVFAFPCQTMASKVVVDPGHGGSDPGAIGVNGLQEKFVNLDISLKLRDVLQRSGHEVIMTRTDDRYLSLAQRVEFTNAQKADLFVSIHANSYTNSGARGSMVLYYDNAYPQASYPASDAMKALTPYSKQLAQSVLDSLVSAAHTVDLGLTPSAVYVARMGSIPSVLVETAFLSNAKDAALLADEAVRTAMAEGIAKGITAYAPPAFLDIANHWAEDAVLRMKNKGWVEGDGAYYEPDRALTRAEFLTLMDRVFDFSALQKKCQGASVTSSVYGCKPEAEAKASYKDMNASHWANEAFQKAGALNLLQGYQDGTIRPDKPITRAEVAVLFQRLLNAKAAGAQTALPSAGAYSAVFKDVPAQLWCADAVYSMRKLGLVDGVTTTQFKPDQSMTRAEIAVVMDRYAAKGV